MIHFCDREITGERLVLDSKTELYYLGHELTLRDCTLVLKVPARALVISKARLIDCTLEVKGELKNFRWNSAFLRGCRFTGRLTGCDFGQRPHEWEGGGIEHCDFSAAQLHGCQFIGCDASSLRFPSWPCFTLLEPLQRVHEWSKVRWPGQLGAMVELLADSPRGTAAVTLSAPHLGKVWGASEAAIQAALRGLDGVIF